MKKVYFFVPLAFLIIFAVFYAKFVSGYNAREQGRMDKIKQEKEAARMEDARKREIAYKEAVRAKEQRDKERAEKAAQKQRDEEARDLANQNRSKARSDAEKLEAQSKKLEKDIADTKVEIAKIEEEKKHTLAEENFLKEFVKKAQANDANLTAVLEKIAAADKAAEDARAAAANAKK